MSMGKYKFPFLECCHHPGRQRAYIICVHVIDQGAKPTVVNMASDEDMGDILCAECEKLTGEEWSKRYKELLRPICEGCAVEHGFLLAENK